MRLLAIPNVCPYARSVRNMTDAVWLHTQIPAELHRRLRVRAAERGLTIKEFVRLALEREITEAAKRKPKR